MSAVLDDAVKRLQTAIGALEITIGRRLDVEHRRGDLETELQLMQDDRARLAVELESTSARLNRVETATDHIERRVHRAIATIRDVLSRAETSTQREG
jgi:predicted  nucleic acid-binding Zn-ribbon protein